MVHSILAYSDTLHLDNRPHIQYALECIELTIFNSSEGVLEIKMEQLTKENDGWLKNFGYGLILISFSLEWILFLLPQHISLEPVYPRVPWMWRWVDLMSKHADPSSMRFTTKFFRWLCMQLIMIECYPYAGMDFHGDPELMLPDGGRWSAIDKTKNILIIF